MIEDRNTLNVKELTLKGPEASEVFNFNPQLEVSSAMKAKVLNGVTKWLDWFATTELKTGEGVNTASTLATAALIFPEEIQRSVTDEQWEGVRRAYPPKSNIPTPNIKSNILLALKLLSPARFAANIWGDVPVHEGKYNLEGVDADFVSGIRMKNPEKAMKFAFAAKILDKQYFESNSNFDIDRSEWEGVVRMLLDQTPGKSVIQSGLSLGYAKAVNGGVIGLIGKHEQEVAKDWSELRSAWRQSGRDLQTKDRKEDWVRYIEATAAMSLLSADISFLRDGIKLDYPTPKFSTTTIKTPERRKF